jgi:hypothetical protein
MYSKDSINIHMNNYRLLLCNNRRNNEFNSHDFTSWSCMIIISPSYLVQISSECPFRRNAFHCGDIAGKNCGYRGPWAHNNRLTFRGWAWISILQRPGLFYDPNSRMSHTPHPTNCIGSMTHICTYNQLAWTGFPTLGATCECQQFCSFSVAQFACFLRVLTNRS